MNMEPASYKVIFLGNPGVGKTTLFRKLKYPDNNKERMTDSLNMTPCMLEFSFQQSMRVQVCGIDNEIYCH